MRFRWVLAAVAVGLLVLYFVQFRNGAPVTVADEPPPKTPTGPDSLLASGEEIYWEGDFEGAREIFRDALARARRDGSVDVEARALTWLGLAAWRLGETGEAERLGEEALALKLRHDLTADLARSYNALGLLAWTGGRLPEAADLFEKTSSAARAAEDAETEAKAANNLALVHADLGEFDEARRSYRASLAAAREIADTLIQGRVLSNLGTLEVHVGDPAAGIALLEEARSLYHSSGDATGEQHTLGQLGVAYIALDRPRRAFAVLDSALGQARASGLRAEEASDLGLIGELYRRAGDHRRALDFQRRARAIYDELGLEFDRGSSLRSLAQIHLALGSPAVARGLAEEALEVHRGIGARVEMLDDVLLLAWLAETRGDRAESSRHLDVARGLAAEIDSRGARTALALAEARIAEAADDPGRTLAVLETARGDLEAGGFRSIAETEWLRSRALMRLDRTDEAVEAGRRAVAAVERVRRGFATGALRTAVTFEKRAVYADLVEALLRSGRSEGAFEVADAAIGRSLVERVALGARTDAVASMPVVEREDLLRRIDELTVRLDELDRLEPEERDDWTEAARKAMEARLAEARRRYEELVIRRSEADPGEALLGGGRTTTREIVAALDPDEAIVEYFLTPERLHVFVVDRRGVRHTAIEVSPEDLQARVRMAKEIAASPERPDVPAILSALHREIFEPILDRLTGARRLVLVADGPLVDLPFAALRDPSERFLVERFALLHLPAAAMIPALRPGDQGERGTAVATARILVPFPGELPFTDREANVVERTLGHATVRDGREATEDEARRALARRAVVHIASHGSLDPTSPLFSRILLARGSGEPTDDGRLEVHELLSLSIRSPLVYLSGCETGAGAAWTTLFDRGQDFTTLARAFLFAGASNVVATQWRIEDEGAAAFAQRFYRHLRGHEAADALALAQRETVRDPRYAAPHYWAGYRLSGGGGRILAQSDSRIPFYRRWWHRLRGLTPRSSS